jgi:hypothetical protein
LCKILNGQEIKPHKVRYYLERRDPEFIVRSSSSRRRRRPPDKKTGDAVAIISFNQEPVVHTWSYKLDKAA